MNHESPIIPVFGILVVFVRQKACGTLT
uniref:Uncharacterized protein n=1 Tax=Rhizophora mucronata TaxID=61149 RepID=A0A2P2QTK5_RHIMU